MKRNILLACVYCVLLCLSSCDDYLDVVPKGKSVLNTTEDYLGLLESINNMEYPIDDLGYVANEKTWYKLTELEGYKAMIRSAGFFWDEDFDRAGNIINTESSSYLLYSYCYARIARYNILIDNIEKADGPESDKIIGMAQAKAMRAYNYFFLLNTFAKPYNPATSATDNGIIVRKNFELEAEARQVSVAETYAFILQDLDEAINDLPEKAINTLRPDKAFGYAFRAKVHLFMREPDKALDDALEAIKFSHHQLWDLNAEVTNYLAQNPYMSMMPESMIWMMMRTMLRHSFTDSENLLYCYNSIAGGPSALRKNIRVLFDESSDLRYNLICNPQVSYPTAEQGILVFLTPTTIMINESGIRLSEAYLMIAECYARKGNIGLSLQYLNDLRKYRIATSHYRDLTADDVDNDPNKMLTTVREERSRELFATCNSFFDMRRFCTEFNETLTKTYIDSEGGSHTYTLKPYSHLLTFPFPLNAMQTSNLIQNSK